MLEAKNVGELLDYLMRGTERFIARVNDTEVQVMVVRKNGLARLILTYGSFPTILRPEGIMFRPCASIILEQSEISDLRIEMEVDPEGRILLNNLRMRKDAMSFLEELVEEMVEKQYELNSWLASCSSQPKVHTVRAR